MIQIVTHSGSFHADDVFSIAAFQLLLGKNNITVTRTRDEEVIASADYVVDVGGVYNHGAKRYDHHQNGAPVRENGIPYAGFGLMWHHYGEEICGSKEVADKIEEKLCWPVDLGDNAISVWESGVHDIKPFEWDGVLKVWQAEPDLGEDSDVHFLQAVDVARGYLERIIIKGRSKIKQKELAEHLYESSAEKTVLVSDQYIARSLFISHEDVNIIIFPRDDTGDWMAVAVQEKDGEFATRVRFPESWAGLRDGDLAEVSGVADAKFCHKDRYMFITKSKESAIAAAKLAT